MPRDLSAKSLLSLQTSLPSLLHDMIIEIGGAIASFFSISIFWRAHWAIVRTALPCTNENGQESIDQ